MPISIRGIAPALHGWACAAAVVLAALGCAASGDGDHDSGGDGGSQDHASANICKGDQWASDAKMVTALAECTTVAGNVSITGNQLKGVVELPLLTRVDGLFTIWSNPLLTRVAAPKLTSVGGFLEVSYNEALTELALPALETVNAGQAVSSNFDLAINDNPVLPTCQADAIRDRLRAHGFDGRVVISGNHDTCPALSRAKEMGN